MGTGAGMDGCGKFRPNGIRFSEHAARNESLYRLSYPGPIITVLHSNCFVAHDSVTKRDTVNRFLMK